MASMTLDTLTLVSGNLVTITAWTFTCPAGTDPILQTANRNVACDGQVDRLDAGSGPGYVQILDASNNVLAEITCDDPAFGASATGTAAAAGLPISGFVTMNGTAAKWRAFDSNDLQQWEGTTGT